MAEGDGNIDAYGHSDDDKSSDGDADPLYPFHPGTFSGYDAMVETLRLYGEVHNDPKRKIICQGWEGDDFHVDYEALTKKLSYGESIFYSLFLICIVMHRKPV
jgi:hypothetical protein